MSSSAKSLADGLARHAEAVCRHYLSNGRRYGGYWIVGDIRNASGRSTYVRLKPKGSDVSDIGRWTDYVAPRFMLRILDWALSHGRLPATTQHNFGVSRGAA